MSAPEVVIDTCVVIAALRSQLGASHEVLLRTGTGSFEMHLSLPLLLEYEQVAKRQCSELGLTPQTIDDILDYLCSISHQCEIHYLWRPGLSDPDDDMVLEVAVAGQCDSIVTFNVRDFAGARRFGIRVITPQEFLKQLGHEK
jgi:putative PIN family toxin of toxin-antitoxin system